MTNLVEAAQAWMAEDPDASMRDIVSAWIDAEDEESLQRAFGQRLQFGTAGLRGILGPGPAHMNRALVCRVSMGLGRYVLDRVDGAAERGIVVGADARHMSAEFLEDTLAVLSSLGLRVYHFPFPVATPIVAHAVTRLNAAAGVVITASHNPPEYNGYKAYWENGAQIIPPHDDGISEAIDLVESIAGVAVDSKRLVALGDEMLDLYFEAIEGLRRRPQLEPRIRVCYTPLHGVGGRFVQRALSAGAGAVAHLSVVEEQFEPDGDFPTVRFPNPEEAGALDLAIQTARDNDASLILANDPDVDRLAAAVRQEDGEYRVLNGNEIGALLGDYLLSEDGENASTALVMTTIVSSRLLSLLAKHYGAAYGETLTGFKWIANASREHEAKHGSHFLFGYEEALGYTVGMVTPDKDGISAAVLLAELASVCAEAGKSLLDRLEDIHRCHGLHVSHLHTLTLPGAAGARRIRQLMENLRSDPPTEVDGLRVVKSVDYAPGVDGLEPSNVLAFDLEDGGQILARPSGTEPKIKFYFELRIEMRDDEREADARLRVGPLMDSLVQAFVDRAVPSAAE